MASFNENAAIRGAIRRVFARSPLVREVLMEGRREVPKYKKDGSLAKKPAVQYNCQVCGEWVSSTKMAVDHIIPVVSTDDGFVDWNEFVKRLWCAKENLQRICSTCHQFKTNKERWERKLNLDLPLIQECIQLSVLSRSSYHQEMLYEKIGQLGITKKKLENYPPEIVKTLERLKMMLPKKTKKKK